MLLSVEFASHLLSYMYSKGTKVNSPTLLKLTTIKRDLSQCLQEEKRQSKSIKTTSANQFASSRTSSETNNSITFVPFESYYVIIEDVEGLHCPIFKEYPMQMLKDESSAHFKVPRLPYPIFYWESPIGQCPFIPPLVNDTAHQTRKSSQPAGQAAEKGKNLDNSTTNQIKQDLRAKALRNSAKQLVVASTSAPPKILFEPAMTDTSILTAKTNLNKQYTRNNPHPHAHLVHNTPINHPTLKITPNISVNVNRTVVSATTPKQAAIFTGNSRKLSPIVLPADENRQGHTQTQTHQQTLLHQRKREKHSGFSTAAAIHRARPGYCECCCEKYSELEKHVKEPMHRQFALQSDNYEGIDNFLVGLKRQFKPEYSYKLYDSPMVLNDNSAILLENSLIAHNSPISPTPTTTTGTFVSTARNYTGTKKMKQSIASKRIKMIANTTTSSILEEEEAEASGVLTILSATNLVDADTTNDDFANTNDINAAGHNNNNNIQVNYISSPSCKRRKSFKLVR